MSNLLPESAIVSMGLSPATLAKVKQAGKLLTIAAANAGMNDPETVSPLSSTLVINLLYRYSGLANPSPLHSDLKSRDTVQGIITGLRWVYRNNGHKDNWTVRTINGVQEAHGNPMDGNLMIKEFKKVHNKKLAEHGKVVRSGPPLSADHIIKHGKSFLLRSMNNPENAQSVDKRDFMLHAMLLVQMNCGMRYDEISKVTMANMKCTKYGISFGIGQITKNSTNYRSYKIRKWPGDAFARSILMDPFFALASWIAVRRDRARYLFCNIASHGICTTI